MGEVAEMLGEDSSAVRYWSNYFSKYIKPERNAKGNRLFHPDDVEVLKTVHFLLKNQGMTLDGVKKRLSADDGELEYKMKIVRNLQSIRAQLQEIYEEL